MSTTTQTSRSLERPDTNNATIIGWYERTYYYDPDQRWEDDRYPRRYGDYYKDKDLTNNGYKHGDYWNKAFFRWLENDQLIRICSGQLPLTQRERARAKGLFHRLRGNQFGTHKESYAVATCLYVIETEDGDDRRAHPNVPDKKKSTQLTLENVSQRFNVSEKWIRKAYARVERWVRLGELDQRETFDKYREELPLEYQYRLTELWLQEGAE